MSHSASVSKSQTVLVEPSPRTYAAQHLAEMMRTGSCPIDRSFDRFLPEALRLVSPAYWTPLAVAKRAADWLEDLGIRTVVDLGSGAGKILRRWRAIRQVPVHWTRAVFVTGHLRSGVGRPAAPRIWRNAITTIGGRINHRVCVRSPTARPDATLPASNRHIAARHRRRSCVRIGRKQHRLDDQHPIRRYRSWAGRP